MPFLPQADRRLATLRAVSRTDLQQRRQPHSRPPQHRSPSITGLHLIIPRYHLGITRRRRAIARSRGAGRALFLRRMVLGTVLITSAPCWRPGGRIGGSRSARGAVVHRPVRSRLLAVRGRTAGVAGHEDVDGPAAPVGVAGVAGVAVFVVVEWLVDVVRVRVFGDDVPGVEEAGDLEREG